MSKKLTALQSQLISTPKCMKVCSVNAIDDTYKYGRWVLIDLLIVVALITSWSSITGGFNYVIEVIGSLIGNVLAALNLGGVFSWLGSLLGSGFSLLGSGLYTICIEPVVLTYHFIDNYTQWAT